MKPCSASLSTLRKPCSFFKQEGILKYLWEMLALLSSALSVCCSAWVSSNGVWSCFETNSQTASTTFPLQVIFSQTSENLERQSSMASSTEEVSGTNDLSTDSKQHDTTDTEQKFGMYMREFDFLEYELESLEVMMMAAFFQCFRVPVKIC